MAVSIVYDGERAVATDSESNLTGIDEPVGQTYNASVTYSSGIHTFSIAVDPLSPSGDLVVLCLAVQSPNDGSGGLPASPSGWTRFGSGDFDCVDGGKRLRTALYWRRQLSGESSYSIDSLTATARDQRAGGYFFVFRGAKSVVLVATASQRFNAFGGSGFPNYIPNRFSSTLLSSRVTRGGDACAAVAFNYLLGFGVGGGGTEAVNQIGAGRLHNYVDYAEAVVATATKLPVVVGYLDSMGGTDYATTAFRFNVIARRNGGLFGGGIF